MTVITCNSCGTSWTKPDPQAVIVPHVCPEKLIDQHAECDPVTGKTVKAATYKTVANRRNENFRPDPNRPGEHLMVSEGDGVTEAN